MKKNSNRTAQNVASGRISAARADALYGATMVKKLTDAETDPMRAVSLDLAATMCHTAARQLDQARAIVRGEKRPTPRKEPAA